MADQNLEDVTNNSDFGGRETSKPNYIVLRPVSPAPESGGASSVGRGRPLRLKRKPKRLRASPSPSPPREEVEDIDCVKEELHAESADDTVNEDLELDAVEEDEHDSADDVDVIEGDHEQVMYFEGPGESITQTKGKGRRIRSKGQLWRPVCSLPSEEMFQKWKKESEEKIFPAKWMKKRRNETKTGLKRYLACTVRGCRAELCITYPSDSENVEVAHNGKGHVHPLTPKKRGIPEETKKVIKKLFDSGHAKPRLVKAALDRMGLDVTQSQIANFLSRLKKDDVVPTGLSMASLEEWCTAHSISQPTAAFDGDIDRVYVFNHTVDEETSQFRIVISSRRLMKFAAQAQTINVDAYHCMKWFNALVLFVGVSDASGAFFPVMFAVISKETKSNYLQLFTMLKRCVEAGSKSEFRPTCVLGRGDASLSEAVEKVFPGAARRLCWLQVKKETAAILRGEDSEVREACEKDVEALRLCSSEEQFELAAGLMLDKWRQALPSSDAPNLFEERFVRRNPGWYEGFDIASQSSNKPLLAAVNEVKNRHSLRERLPPERYLGLAMELVLEWSVRASEVGKLKTSLKPDKVLLTETCRLQSEQKSMMEINAAIYVPVGDRTNVSVEEVDDFENKMQGGVKSFDEFVQVRDSLWKVTDPSKKYELSRMRCTCPKFLSKKLCEHVLAICSAFGTFTLPEWAWESSREPGEGRKRGRPPKKKASETDLVAVAMQTGAVEQELQFE